MTSYDVKIDTSGLGQLTAETCWLSTYKLLFRAAKRPDSGIASDIRGAKLPYDDYYYNGLPRTDYVGVRDALKLDSYTPSYIKGLVDDAKGFVGFLQSRGPIWTSIERSGKLHIILVNGYDGTLKQVHALNPWSNIAAGSVETMYIPFSDFKSWVTNDRASCQAHPSWQVVPFNPST